MPSSFSSPFLSTCHNFSLAEPKLEPSWQGILRGKVLSRGEDDVQLTADLNLWAEDNHRKQSSRFSFAVHSYVL